MEAIIVYPSTELQHHFNDTLPLFPFITDECEDGCWKEPKKKVGEFRHVQPNSSTHQHWLTFDIDHEQGALTWDFNHCPPPNLVCQNPKNGHAHLLYGLKTPVRTAEDGRQHPQRYARAIKDALTLKLGADLGYSGFLVKNPLNESWRVLSFERDLYELNDLHDYLDLKPASFIQDQTELSLGRNVTLFNELRSWAYKHYRLTNYPTYENWLPDVRMKAIELNARFNQPLTEAELKNTCRSVAKYCVKNFSAAQFSSIQSARGRKGGRPKISAEQYSKIQSERGKKGGRPKISAEVVTEIQRLSAKGFSQRVISKQLNLGLSTVRRYSKHGT